MLSGGETDAFPVQHSLNATGKGLDMCQQPKQLDGPVPKSTESRGKTPTDFKKVLPE